jgi:hypothetical protein
MLNLNYRLKHRAVCHADLAPVTDTRAGSQGLTQRPVTLGL